MKKTLCLLLAALLVLSLAACTAAHHRQGQNSCQSGCCQFLEQFHFAFPPDYQSFFTPKWNPSGLDELSLPPPPYPFVNARITQKSGALFGSKAHHRKRGSALPEGKPGRALHLENL